MPYLQYSEGADDHNESTLPYIPGNVRSSDHDGSTLPYQQGEDERRMPIMEVVWLEEWFRRSDYWVKTLSKDLHQQPTPELVGTPTEIKGGGGSHQFHRIAKISELKTDNAVEERICALRTREVPKVKSIVFTTEKIWGQSPQKADDARLKLKEAGTEEGQIVFVQQVIIPSESDLVSFTDASRTEADVTHRTVRIVPKDLPRKNDIVNALNMNDFVINESEKQLDENDEVYCIPVGVKEPAGRPASEFRSNLEQLSEGVYKV